MSITIFQAEAGITIARKETWLLNLTALFLLTYFLPRAPVINNIAILALAILCFAYNTRREKWQLLKARPAIIVMIIFYLLQLVSALLSDDTARGFLYLQVRIPLLLFPISLGLIYIRPAIKVRMYLLYSVIITLAAVYCLVNSLIVYNRTGDSGFLYNDSLTDAIGKQSVYFALMVNVAIFSYGYLLFKNLVLARAKTLIVAAIAFLMIIHFMLASRMEIIFLYSTSVIFALYYFFVKKRNIKAGILMIGAIVFCGILFVILFPKTINRFNELLYPKYDLKSDAVESHYNMQLTADQWNGLNIRLAIWNCGLDVIKRNPVFGVGLGDKDKALTDVYAEKEFSFGIRTNKNMHSTYMDMLASMGLIGLLIFLTGFLAVPMLSAIRTRDIPGALVLIDFMLSFITETYPDRSMGCIIFGFFIAFIMSYKPPVQSRSDHFNQ